MEPPAAVTELLGKSLPDITLAGPDGIAFPLRQFAGRCPFALFVYIRNGTPG